MSSEPLRRAAEHAAAFLAGLPERPVGAGGEPAFDPRLPDEGVDAARVVDELAAAAEPGLVASAGPRYFGFVVGGALPAAVGADWLASAWDQNAGGSVMSPAAAQAEAIAGEWVKELLGLPSGASVGLVTGATMANLTGLAAGRHALLAAAGWDVEADGLQGAPPVQVVVGERVHVTALAALRLLGLGAARAHRVPADAEGRMRPEALAAALDGPALVAAQAGEVNTGACDPLEEIADLVHRHEGWLHVDGAFGLWAAASPARRGLVAGAERADSWAIDAHKWLNVPYDSGIAIVRDPVAHRAAMALAAAYLMKGGGRDGSDWAPETSRRARAFPLYAALRSLGRRGVADLVDRCCELAARAADRFRAAGVRVINEVVLDQVLLDLDPSVAARAQREGTCWVGATEWEGRPAVRFSVVNWSTTPDDIDRSVDAILAAWTSST